MLLHGSYMSIEKNESPDGRCLYRPKSSLKRYFHLTCLPKRMWSCWRTASLLPPVACLFVPQQLQLKSKPINDFLNSIHLALSYWTPVPWKTSILLLTKKKEEKTSFPSSAVSWSALLMCIWISGTGISICGILSSQNCSIWQVMTIALWCWKVWENPLRITCAVVLSW